jgi:hypothetical protein
MDISNGNIFMKKDAIRGVLLDLKVDPQKGAEAISVSERPTWQIENELYMSE